MKRKRGEGTRRLRIFFTSVTRYSRPVFSLCRRNSATRATRCYVRFCQIAVQRLRRRLFTYLSYKIFTSCLNAFRRALFALSVLYAN